MKHMHPAILLSQVQLPFLRADVEGKVCFAAVEQIKTVLKYFTEICQVNIEIDLIF